MILETRIPFSYIFKLLWKEILLAVTIVGTLSYVDQFLVEWFAFFNVKIEFPIFPWEIPSIFGSTITLILAFRMNQSYDRWWEARKVWGAIVNDSRALVREVVTFSDRGATDDDRNKFSRKMAYLLAAWNHALKGAMREVDIQNDIQRYITKDELSMLMKLDKNLPNAILLQMMKEVKTAYQSSIITEYQQIQIVNTINGLGDSMGKSERIKKTVFPHMYSKLIDYSIWSFAFILPLAYRDVNEYVEFPISLSITLFFITLEKLAEGLQDPFSGKATDISISSIARNNEIFILNALGETNVPEPEPVHGFYLM